MAASTTPSDARMRRSQFSWCLYDWANSAFPTIIVTFVFAAYFVKDVAKPENPGAVYWGYALAASGFAIAVLSPIFGAISDHVGPRKPWLATFSIIAICAAGLTWFVEPSVGFIVLALTLFAVGNTAFEMGMVFYNSMLLDLVPQERMGWLSGWGWGLGYFGGLACLLLAYFAFISPDVPLFGLDKGKDAREHVRIAGPLVGVWFAVFAVPLFLFTPDRASTGIGMIAAVRRGLTTLWATLRRVRQHANLARFLFARMIYIDGLNTLFALGAIYATETFGMGIVEVFQFAIAINVTAGIGAILFGYIDDRIGSKATIILGLIGLIALGVPLLVVESKLTFWALAVPLGLFMGPTQAASRTMMARLTPEGMEVEMFGLFAFSGKATAFLGPFVFAWASGAFSQRVGMATVIVFLLAGLLLLLPVRESGRQSGG